MSVLIKLNAGQRTAVRGPYKKQHICEPLKIEFPDFYILHEEIREVPELKLKINFDPLPRFTIGDGSDDDLRYQQYLIDQNEEL